MRIASASIHMRSMKFIQNYHNEHGPILLEENIARVCGDESDSSSDQSDSNSDQVKIKEEFIQIIATCLVSNSASKSLSAVVNTSLTSQISALIGSKHDGKMREVASNSKTLYEYGCQVASHVYTSKGKYLINDSLTERGPILLGIPNGRNKLLVMAAYSIQSIPKLYPIVGFCKELPGIALPPPIPLDLSKMHPCK